MNPPRPVARVVLPTPVGEFDTHLFECSGGYVYLALTRGVLDDGTPVLVRVHSECLTGDVLGSLRCDCGGQLRLGLRRIAAEGRGVLVYATGQEGRGIGLVNKLLAYVEQDGGADTFDANIRLGLPVDMRTYHDAAAVLRALGVRCVRLLTNNPTKAEGLTAHGIRVERMEPLITAAHSRNLGYLQTKGRRLGHHEPAGGELVEDLPVADVSRLVGDVRPRAERPYVVLKYAQTIDGRIATASGDSKWISGDAERRISHGLRAACDGVLVGVGTVIHDDPQLTVRLVPGASPLRIVVDSTLRTPLHARILDGDAMTIVLTTSRASHARRAELAARQVAVRVVPPGPGGVDVVAALQALRDLGIHSLLVEGGAKVITSLLSAAVVDRLIVGVAPTIIGAGTEAVGDLGVGRVAEGLRLTNRCLHVMPDDILVAWDVAHDRAAVRPAGALA